VNCLFGLSCFPGDLHRAMGELLLGDHFNDCSQNDDAIAAFKRGMSIAVNLLQGVESDERLFQALNDLLTSQWTNPVLNKILNGDKVDKETGL